MPATIGAVVVLAGGAAGAMLLNRPTPLPGPVAPTATAGASTSPVGPSAGVPTTAPTTGTVPATPEPLPPEPTEPEVRTYTGEQRIARTGEGMSGVSTGPGLVIFSCTPTACESLQGAAFDGTMVIGPGEGTWTQTFPTRGQPCAVDFAPETVVTVTVTGDTLTASRPEVNYETTCDGSSWGYNAFGWEFTGTRQP